MVTGEYARSSSSMARARPRVDTMRLRSSSWWPGARGRTDGAPRGVHTGDQHERGDPEHDGRVDQLAVHLGVEQLAQEVVAGLVLATPDLGDEEVDEPRAPLFAPNRVVGELEHVAHPAVKVSDSSGGTPRMWAITRTGICCA